jgi:hypothetical protein
MKKNIRVKAARNTKCRSKNKGLTSHSLTKKFMLSAVQVIAEKIVSLKK